MHQRKGTHFNFLLKGSPFKPLPHHFPERIERRGLPAQDRPDQAIRQRADRPSPANPGGC